MTLVCCLNSPKPMYALVIWKVHLSLLTWVTQTQLLPAISRLLGSPSRRSSACPNFDDRGGIETYQRLCAFVQFLRNMYEANKNYQQALSQAQNLWRQKPDHPVRI